MWRSDRGVLLRASTALLPLAAACLLSGCMVVPRLPTSPTTIEYSGRFAVSWQTIAPDSPLQRSTGRFLLRVDGPRSELEVSSPLGQTLAVATLAPGSAILVTANGARLEADHPEALTQKAFGWPAPLSELPRWLRDTRLPAGDTRPASGATSPEAAVVFTDANWQVSIDTWEQGAPRRLTLRWPADASAVSANAGAQTTRNVELRLLMDDQPTGTASR